MTTTEETPAAGHNVGGVAGDRLRSFIERIERLEEEKAALAADIRDVKAEAKSVGFDTKAMATILKRRKMDSDDRREQDHLVDLYERALIAARPLPLLDGSQEGGLEKLGTAACRTGEDQVEKETA